MKQCIGLNLEKLPFDTFKRLFIAECLKEGGQFVQSTVTPEFGVIMIK